MSSEYQKYLPTFRFFLQLKSKGIKSLEQLKTTPPFNNPDTANQIVMVFPKIFEIENLQQLIESLPTDTKERVLLEKHLKPYNFVIPDELVQLFETLFINPEFEKWVQGKPDAQINIENAKKFVLQRKLDALTKNAHTRLELQKVLDEMTQLLADEGDQNLLQIIGNHIENVQKQLDDLAAKQKHDDALMARDIDDEPVNVDVGDAKIDAQVQDVQKLVDKVNVPDIQDAITKLKSLATGGNAYTQPELEAWSKALRNCFFPNIVVP